MIRFTALALLLQCLAAHASYHIPDPLLTIILPGAPPIQYSYNEAGLRDSQSQNGQTLHYLYDQTSLIAETNTNNDEIARYTHSSVGLIAEARSGIQTYIHGDVLSTPIAITDTSGAVTTRYTWDTWGNLQQQSGFSQQPFGFTGYQRDAQTGLHYAQQRYYDAEIGRFNRHDPFLGDIDTPLSLHRYLYANANPTIYVDPTGEYPYLQEKADQLAAFRQRQRVNAGNFQGIADSGIAGRSIGVLASLGSGLLGAGAGLLEGGTRSVNFAANLSTRVVISDNSKLAGQLYSELDDSFAAIDQVLTGAESAARLVVEDPVKAGTTAAQFAVSNAQKLGNQLDRAFIQGDTQAFAEVTEFTVGAVVAGSASRVAVVSGRQGLRQAGDVVEQGVDNLADTIENRLVQGGFEPDVRFGSFDDLSEFGGDLFADVSRGGVQVQANRAPGKAAENITEGALRQADDFAGRQVTIETSTGQRTVIDFVTRQRGVVETKLNSARLSPGQRQLFDDIQNGRMVTPRGQRALEAGLRPGEPTTLSGCRIDRICQ